MRIVGGVVKVTFFSGLYLVLFFRRCVFGWDWSYVFGLGGFYIWKVWCVGIFGFWILEMRFFVFCFLFLGS